MAEAVGLRRGLLRLLIGLAVLWIVFWTFAYVLHPATSLRPEPAFTVRIASWSVWGPCAATLALFIGWVAAGFRRD